MFFFIRAVNFLFSSINLRAQTHLSKGGTPDMRYKSNREIYTHRQDRIIRMI
jgi:hypothetical protein